VTARACLTSAGPSAAGRDDDEVIADAQATGLASLVLHASDAGRPLYERLGFVATNEMRLDWR
jgi:hypothetical protein